MNGMLGKNDIVHSQDVLSRQPDPFDPLVDQVLAGRRGTKRPTSPAPSSPTAAIETANVAMFRQMLAAPFRDAFDGLVRQVAYDAFEEGQEQVSQCCGCSGTDNPFASTP